MYNVHVYCIHKVARGVDKGTEKCQYKQMSSQVYLNMN